MIETDDQFFRSTSPKESMINSQSLSKSLVREEIKLFRSRFGNSKFIFIQKSIRTKILRQCKNLFFASLYLRDQDLDTQNIMESSPVIMLEHASRLQRTKVLLLGLVPENHIHNGW